MNTGKMLKMIMLDKGMKPGAVADLVGDDRQVFYNKLSRGIKRCDDLEKVAAVVGCSVVLQDNETGKIYK